MTIKIQRQAFNKLKKHLTSQEMSLIVGPRQAGKTTVMLWLKKLLEEKGAKTLFLNLDIEAHRQFFSSQAKLIQKINLEVGKNKAYIFIDEIQRKENAGLFLKGIYDMRLPYKFIVSGSGSVELKEKIHESLAGRKRLFELNTLSFDEFVNFKTDYKYQNKLIDFFELDSLKTKELFEEYLNFGGYPRVVLAPTIEEKQKEISEIYQSYLEKDISYLLGVQKTEAFTSLVKIMSSQIGSLTNYSELSSTLGLALQTVQNYLWYLQKTYILQKLPPFYRNIRKEINKSPLFYFYDLGFRNYALGAFGQAAGLRDVGFLFENFVFNLLKMQVSSTSAKINFWRTKDGAEVDFVLNLGRDILPVEVKYQGLKKPEVNRSLRSFISKYKPVNAFVVNQTLKKDIKLNSTKVHFIPFFLLLRVNLLKQ